MVHAVHNFLGLMVYYNKFIRSYDDIVASLTPLINVEMFHWTLKAVATFDSLKKTLTTTPILQLSDFTKPFIINYDASGSGMGAILH
jgi:hypothetical protein